jgi:sugar lactone lactonase YvrE
MKITLIFAFVLATSVCFAQVPVRNDLVATTLPLDGAPKAVPGPYKVMSEPAFGSPGHVIFRPEDLARLPAIDKLPVMAWGDGGCAINSARYSGFFTTIASHGFLVIGSVPQPGAERRQQTADDLRKAIEWAEKENVRAGSPLRGKIATDQVAVMGQSCGGFLSITLGADPRVKTIGVFNSGVQPARPESNEDAARKIHGPVLLINGSERDFLAPASLATFQLLNNVPAFYGARHDAGHTATVDHPGGGEYANVASNWLLWQFRNDKRAAKMFAGNDCDLCTNTNWDVRAKGYKDARNEGPAATFTRGSNQQAWQNAGYKAALASCKNPPQPFAISVASNPATATAPLAPVLPPTMSIPGVLEARQSWKVVWSWEGNNVDGPITADNGAILFADNDAGNLMQFDPATGLAKIAYDNINTAGAVSRSKAGTLFVASRGLGGGIEALEPARKMLANSFNGEPFECIGGVLNDLTADAKGGVYFSVTGASQSGVFYASPSGVVSQYGKNVPLANGIILSPDEKTLYVTNGAIVFAFDVNVDGSLTNQREFGKLQGGTSGDGSAVDQQGRVYVATGSSVDVFAADGKFAGTIPGPQGLHGTFFGGRDRKTLYGIVFYGTWGTPSARNQIIAIPTIAQGYTGRAK